MERVLAVDMVNGTPTRAAALEVASSPSACKIPCTPTGAMTMGEGNLTPKRVVWKARVSFVGGKRERYSRRDSDWWHCEAYGGQYATVPAPRGWRYTCCRSQHCQMYTGRQLITTVMLSSMRRALCSARRHVRRLSFIASRAFASTTRWSYEPMTGRLPAV